MLPRLQLSLLLCLQKDYIKWKGSLFFRIVICIVDENEDLNKFGKLLVLWEHTWCILL